MNLGEAQSARDGSGGLQETIGYSIKRRLLGPPMVTDRLEVERLSKPLALGVLSCDGISSANYGSELILHELLPFFGLAAFTLLLPMTGVILAGVAFVVLSYREVVKVYTRAGGSYVVAGRTSARGSPRWPRSRSWSTTWSRSRCRPPPAARRSCRPSRRWAGRWADDHAAAHLGRRDLDHVLRQPAGGPGERQGVRAAHLPVLGVGGADDPGGPVPGTARRRAAARRAGGRASWPRGITRAGC